MCQYAIATRAAAARCKSHRSGAAWALPTAGSAHVAGVKYSRQAALVTRSSAWVRHRANAGCSPRCGRLVQIAPRWSRVGTSSGQRPCGWREAFTPNSAGQMAAQCGCAIMQTQAVIRAAAAQYESHRAGAAWELPTAGSARAAGVKHSRQTALAECSSARVRQHAAAGCSPRCYSTVQIAPRWSSVGTANRGQHPCSWRDALTPKQRWPPHRNPRCCSAVQIAPRWSSVSAANRR